MGSEFYKVNVFLVLALELGLKTLCKNTLRTLTSHHLTQTWRSSRATQESLWRRMWLVAHHQIFSRMLQNLHCYKRLPQLVGWADC